MTSGQGGTEDQGGPPPSGQQPPYGQPPQYGQPPYGQPPQYGQPPYGQPPQYGQPPYGQPPYGYAPAPSVAPGPPPEPMERPVTVRAGLGAFLASIVFSIVGFVVSLLNWDLLLDQALAAQGTQLEDLEGSGLDVAELAELGVRIGIGIGIVFVALQLLFVWFAWRGRNWARIVLWVIGGLGLVTGLVGVLAQASPLPFLNALSVFQLLATAVGIVLLALKPSNDWYSHEKHRRAMIGPR